MNCDIKCKYYNESLHICNDKEVFLDRVNVKLIVCRYSKNAIPFADRHKKRRKSNG